MNKLVVMSEEAWIGVFDHAAFAVFFNRAVTLQGNLTILDVKLLQSSAVVGDTLHAPVGDQVAAS